MLALILEPRVLDTESNIGIISSLLHKFMTYLRVLINVEIDLPQLSGVVEHNGYNTDILSGCQKRSHSTQVRAL